MPAKKKQSKIKQKEEILEASSMQDGNSNYYIGGWSHYQVINDLSNIAHNIITRHTGDDRRVKPLPHTTVLLVPPLRICSSGHTAHSISCQSTLESSMETSNEQETNCTHALHQRVTTQDAFSSANKCQTKSISNDIECIVTVCDKMNIEGVSRRAMNDAAMHFRSLLSTESYKLANIANPPVDNTPDNDNENNKTKHQNSIDNNNNNNQSIDNKNVNSAYESLFALQPEVTDKLVNNYSYDDHNQNNDSDETNKLQEINSTNVTCGAHFSAQDVCISCHDKLIISGVAPCIVIDPILPELTPEIKDYINFTHGANTTNRSDSERRPRSNNSTRTSTTRNSSASANGKRPSSKRRSKVKQTQEELEELERKRAEAVALFEQQTNEAIAKAREEEALASTFAHPDQWPSVVVTNVTFSSPVLVQGAHVVFQHCRFVSPTSPTSNTRMPSALPQLTISQYCHVRCTHCTFEEPIECGVYAYPASQLDLQKCLFTGISHVDLVRNAFTINASNTEINLERWNDRISHVKSSTMNTSHKNLREERKSNMYDSNAADTIEEKVPTTAAAAADDDNDNDDEDNDAHHNYNKVNCTNNCTYSITTTNEENMSNELFLSSTLDTEYRCAQQTRPSAVGVHADQARVSVIKCQFLFLSFGCVFNGCHPSGAHVHSSQRAQTKLAKNLSSESMINVLHSHFYHLYGSGVVLQQNTRHVKVEHNTFANCAYYAIDVQRNVHDSSVSGNTFSHNALLRIRNGGKARVLQNRMESLFVDDNKYENLFLEVERELPISRKKY